MKCLLCTYPIDPHKEHMELVTTTINPATGKVRSTKADYTHVSCYRRLGGK